MSLQLLCRDGARMSDATLTYTLSDIHCVCCCVFISCSCIIFVLSCILSCTCMLLIIYYTFRLKLKKLWLCVCAYVRVCLIWCVRYILWKYGNRIPNLMPRDLNYAIEKTVKICHRDAWHNAYHNPSLSCSMTFTLGTGITSVIGQQSVEHALRRF